ncbi:lipopolysaccharide biosynthesis protein [Brenneria populi subsp. brevivirga]|uniref:lipopolysaccharide biosynthesis protein n=1 Tax=Brenneria populi TaxID=1505588 RepID=UPI002E19D406|nr:lipopolysaccharide biosynthesis protein [Brenneria populi subsp. brevivirga]
MNLSYNIKWVGFTQVGKLISQLLSMIILARLIPPAEFGVMAMATVVVNFSVMFRDLGTSSALIQKKELGIETTNAVFGLNMIMGCGLGLIIVALSPFISSFFNEPKLTYVLILLAFSFPIMSAGAVHLSLLERESRFSLVALIELSASFSALFVSIVAAYKGMGVYSLVLFNLTVAIISTVFLWVKSPWRPTLRKIINLKEVKGIINYSGNLTLFNIINYLSRNADSIIIGRFFNPNILGAYSLAYRIMLFPLQNLTFVVSRSLFPILSKNQDDNSALNEVYTKVVSLVFFIVCPMMLGLAALREPFIYLIFGEQWRLTAELLFWLAPTAIIQSIVSTTGTVFMAKGRTNTLFLLGILAMILQVGAFIIGANFNIILFSQLYFFANLINFFPAMFFTLRLVGGSMLGLLMGLVNSFVCGIIMFSIVFFATRNFSKIIPLLSYYGFVFYISLGVLVYIVTSYFLCKKEFGILLGFLKNKK